MAAPEVLFDLALTLRGASLREGRLLFGDENPRDVAPLVERFAH